MSKTPSGLSNYIAPTLQLADNRSVASTAPALIDRGSYSVLSLSFNDTFAPKGMPESGHQRLGEGPLHPGAMDLSSGGCAPGSVRGPAFSDQGQRAATVSRCNMPSGSCAQRIPVQGRGENRSKSSPAGMVPGEKP